MFWVRGVGANVVFHATVAVADVATVVVVATNVAVVVAFAALATTLFTNITAVRDECGWANEGNNNFPNVLQTGDISRRKDKNDKNDNR